ncbi:MAG: DJ-1 family glyoxalase III [Planctomycetota bacterium]
MSQPKVVVVLAPGFEEIEAVTPIDVLRRAGVEVTVAGVDPTPDPLRVEGSHGITLQVDTAIEDVRADGVAAVVLPGGMPGSTNLGASAPVQELVRKVHAAGGRVAAICAAPAVALARSPALAGRRATCYPGFESRFPPGVEHAGERVVTDGALTTSRGPGTALEFALVLVEQLVSPARAEELRRGLLAR